jgi:hypothetical protein
LTLILRLAGELSFILLKHYGPRLKGLAVSGDLSNDLGSVYLIPVFENFEKVSFFSRGELNSYFLSRLTMTELYSLYVSRYGKEPSLHLVPLDVKETRYGIPFVANLLLRARILYDPKGYLKKATEFLAKHLTITPYGFSMGISGKGEVKEV